MDVLGSYQKQLSDTIETHKKLRDLLVIRVEINSRDLIEIDLPLDSVVNRRLTKEQINLQIEIIKDKFEIETFNKIIDEKEKYFDFYKKQFEKDLLETEENWNAMLKKAADSKNEKVKPFLDALVGIDIDKDYDKKVFIYKRLKLLL